MEDEQLKALLDRHQRGEASQEDLAFLESWYTQYQTESPFLMSEAERKEDVNITWDKIQTDTAPNRLIKLWPKIGTAAAALLLAFGVWLYLKTAEPLSKTKAIIASEHDIHPGKNTATLTLPNGTTIPLSEAKTGIIIDASKLSYNDGTTISTSLQSTANEDVRVSTPRGGTYQIVLPDGSKVWLNAASSITFPGNFKGLAQRDVKLTGEGYFEIARNESQPFIVQSGNQIVKVLGTHFNINSYSDEESIKTTLIEGKVSVSSLRDQSIQPRNTTRPNRETILQPGQQSLITSEGSINIREVNKSDAIAWIEGKFIFNSTSFTSAMNMIARWYNIEVIYNYKPSTLSLGGSISRTRSLADVLKRIEQTEEVRFKTEGRRVTVIK